MGPSSRILSFLLLRCRGWSFRRRLLLLCLFICVGAVVFIFFQSFVFPRGSGPSAITRTDYGVSARVEVLKNPAGFRLIPPLARADVSADSLRANFFGTESPWQARVERECKRRYGFANIVAQQKTFVRVCDGPKSAIDCLRSGLVCVARNVSIRTSDHYTEHRWMTVSSSCEKTGVTVPNKADILMGRLLSGVEEATTKCDVYIPGRTVVLSPDATHNTFHAIATDHFGRFYTLLLAGASRPSDFDKVTTIVLRKFDQYMKGPYWDLFELQGDKAFRVPDLVNEHGLGKTVCFEEIMNNYPRVDHVWNDWLVSPCRDVSLVEAYGRYVVDKLGLEEFSPRERKEAVKVVYSRRTGDIPREDGLEGWKVGRSLTNPETVKECFMSVIDPSTGEKVPVEFKEVNFAYLTIREQIRVCREADILVGVHGAGLTHTWFMKKDSVLVEILPGWKVKVLFRNLARHVGVHYLGVVTRKANDNFATRMLTIDKLDLQKIADAAVLEAIGFGLGYGFTSHGVDLQPLFKI